jgi:hypothetical protein
MANLSLRSLLKQLLPVRRGGAEGGRPGGKPGRTKAAAGRLAVEQLEERCLLSTLQAISLPPANQPPSDTAAGASLLPAVSGDGRYVAFQSTAVNLVPGQMGGFGDNIFLLDRGSGTTTLVSHVAGNATVTPDLLHLSSFAPSISKDGRYVLYTTDAPQILGLSSQGSTFARNVVVYDRTTGQNTLVSHASNAPLTPADGRSIAAAISGDGRFLAFESMATDLVSGQVTTTFSDDTHIFLYDQQTQTMSLVDHRVGQPSVTAFGTSSFGISVADDGTVAYVDYAGDLIADFTANSPAFPNVYLYNPATQTNLLVSHVSGQPTAGAGLSYQPVISGDASTVVYVSQGPNLVAGETNPDGILNIFRYERSTGTNQLVSAAAGTTTMTGNDSSGSLGGNVIAISRNGQFVAFVSSASNLIPGQSGEISNVFLYDASGPGLTLVSGASGSSQVGSGAAVEQVYDDFGAFTAPNGPPVSMSDDGSSIAYLSRARNIVPGQTGLSGTVNVFLYDRLLGNTTLVSADGGSGTATGIADCAFPVLTRDGSLLAFTSLANNLVSGVFDANGVADVLTYQTASPVHALVSRAAFTVEFAGQSYAMSTSADGQFTVFTSTASNLVPNQVTANGGENIFLYDKVSGTTSLVNHIPGFPSTTGNYGLGFAANLQPIRTRPPAVFQPVISANGNYIAFVSADTNLAPPASGIGNVNGANVYLYNRSTGQNTMLSFDDDSPTINADGRYVAYGFGTINLYDSFQDTTTIVYGSPPGTAGAQNPVLSDDGRFVIYENQNNVSVFDRDSGTRTLVSHTFDSSLNAANGTSGAAVVSHDGSTIAFTSAATNLVNGQTATSFTNVFLYRNDGSGAVSLASGVNGSATLPGNGNSDSPAIGLDGSYVAYRSDATNLVSGQISGSNIYEFNTQANTQTLVSHRAGAPTTAVAGDSSQPVIDDDGHLISYVSTADNLIPGQSGLTGIKNVFIWLRQTDANILASGQDGSPTVTGNADSDFPLLTRHSFPGFSSKATNLVHGVGGGSVAYLNTLVQLKLSANVIVDGSVPGSLVGLLSVTSLLAGQYLPPVYRLASASQASFALAASVGNAGLLTRFLASYAGQSSYLVTIHVDIGFGDNTALFQVYVAAPSGVAPPLVRPITAYLVAVKVGKKKKTTRLMVKVSYADTGAEKETFTSPYQKPVYQGIQVSVRDSNGDGVADQVVLTARKGKRKASRIFPA